jgi:hypothetical protein
MQLSASISTIVFREHRRESRFIDRALRFRAIAILVALGWYLLILAAADDAAIIATSTVVS